MKISWKYLLVALISAILTFKLLPPKIEEKTVTEVKERVITRTRILERPDGTKETIIDEKRDTDSKSLKVTTDGADTAIWLSQSLSGEYKGETVYTLGVTKKLLGRLSGGLYGRSDKEVGVILSYSF